MPAAGRANVYGKMVCHKTAPFSLIREIGRPGDSRCRLPVIRVGAVLTEKMLIKQGARHRFRRGLAAKRFGMVSHHGQLFQYNGIVHGIVGGSPLGRFPNGRG